MTISFRNNVVWNAANWVVRGFFDDALAHMHAFPELAEDMEDGRLTGLYSLDLDDASPALLGVMAELVEMVIAARTASGGSDFHDPSGFPVYLAKLHELRELVRDARDGPRTYSGS